MVAAVVATMASYRVLFSSSQAANNSAATAMTGPPGRWKSAFGRSLRLLRMGSAAHVTAYVTSRAIALIVSAATKELFSVSANMTAAVITIATCGVKNRR